MLKKRLAILAAAVLATVAAAVAVSPTLGRDESHDGNAPAPAARRARSGPFLSHRGRPEPPGGMRRRWGRLTPEKIEEVMAFAAKYLPEDYEQIETLREEDPRQARRMLRRAYWLYRRVRNLPDDVRGAAVQRYRLNVAVFKAQREYRMTDDPKARAKLAEELGALIARQFDQNQAVKEYQIKQLARQLAELKAEMEDRRANRDKIISQRLEQILSDRRPE